MNPQVNFLLLGVAIPVVIAALLIIGRRSARRALILFSGGALILMVVTFVSFGIEYGQHAFVFGYLSPPVSDFIRWLSLLNNDALNLGFLLAIAAWVLAMYDASRRRRWLWFSIMLVVMLVSYSAVGILTNESFMREITFYDQLIQYNFLAVSIALTGLSFLITVVTLVHSLVAVPSHDGALDVTA